MTNQLDTVYDEQLTFVTIGFLKGLMSNQIYNEYIQFLAIFYNKSYAESTYDSMVIINKIFSNREKYDIWFSNKQSMYIKTNTNEELMRFFRSKPIEELKELRISLENHIQDEINGFPKPLDVKNSSSLDDLLKSLNINTSKPH